MSKLSMNFINSVIIYTIFVVISNDDDVKHRINDPTLPRTKDFICPNSKCISNTKKTDKEVLINKEAVFYRPTKEYNIK